MNELSEQLLFQVKMKKGTTTLQDQLKSLTLSDLKNQLNQDDKKKAFWINIYNAFYQIIRHENNIEKPAIYRDKLLTIADQQFSLDDVEHGILRRYRFKYSLGFLPNPFVTKLIKTLAVKTIDYRIHFALNCGAKSCPPISFYNHNHINSQLNLATQSFLESETIYDEDNQIVYITALFKWFKGDFGGAKGIKSIYLDQMNKDLSPYQIKYKPYDWSEVQNNFRDE